MITDPVTQISLPDGRIFNLGKKGLLARASDPVNGDLFMTNASYNAMSVMVALGQTVPGSPARSISVPEKSSLYAESFRELCGVTACSMIVLELYDRAKQPSFNEFMFRPPASPSFSNQIYVANATEKLLDNYPTPLIEPYYVCVMTEKDSAIDAIALGKANADVYAAIALTVLLTWLVWFYKVVGIKIKTTNDLLTEGQIVEGESKKLLVDSLKAVSVALHAINEMIANPQKLTPSDLDLKVKHVANLILAIDAIGDGRVNVTLDEVRHKAKPKEISFKVKKLEDNEKVPENTGNGHVKNATKGDIEMNSGTNYR